MSRHHSHLFKGRLTKEREAKIDRALEPFGACVVPYWDPARREWRGWIESENLGSLADTRREMEMTLALGDAGLLPLGNDTGKSNPRRAMPPRMPVRR